MSAGALVGAGLRGAEAAARRSGLSSSRWFVGLTRASQRLLLPTGDALPGWDRDLRGRPMDLDQLASGHPVEATIDLPRRPDRVTVMTPDLDAGGMDVFAHDLALALSQGGVDVSVVHLTDPARPMRGHRLADSLVDRGLLVEQVDVSDVGHWWRRARPGVVSSHGASNETLARLRDVGCPVVETWHGPFGMLKGEEAHARARLPLATAHVVVSEALRERLVSLVPAGAGSTVVTVPNGATPVGGGPSRAAARETLGVTQDETLVVCLARFSLPKNVFALVAAFAEAASDRPDLHLVVAGRVDDAAYTRQVSSLRDRSSAGDRIHLRDLCRRPDVLLRAADAFVLPSYFEGWSLAATEAAMEGVPLVLTDVPGSRELLGAGPATPVGRLGAGYLVPAPLGGVGDLDWSAMGAARYRKQACHSGLVEAVADVSRERPIWEQGRTARGRAAQDSWSWESCVRRHAALLATVEESVEPSVTATHSNEA